MKEFFRKIIVSLKRKPYTIALIALVITFVFYSLNLTAVSDTTAKIQGQGMGLSGFVTMLFSILSIVCFFNTYQPRKKANLPMLIIMMVMIAAVVFCDYYYRQIIYTAVTRTENPIVITESTAYIAKSYAMLGTHMVLLVISAVLILLVPVYAKLIRKINTSVAVEDYGNMEAIDVEED